MFYPHFLICLLNAHVLLDSYYGSDYENQIYDYLGRKCCPKISYLINKIVPLHVVLLGPHLEKICCLGSLPGLNNKRSKSGKLWVENLHYALYFALNSYVQVYKYLKCGML